MVTDILAMTAQGVVIPPDNRPRMVTLGVFASFNTTLNCHVAGGLRATAKFKRVETLSTSKEQQSKEQQ